jgi:hypothetical protein
MDDLNQDVLQTVPPVEPTPAPVAQAEPPKSFNPEINARRVEYLAGNPEAEIDFINRLAQKPGTALHGLIIKTAQAEAREQFGLSKDDTPLLAGNTPDEIMASGAALRKRYDAISAAQPPTVTKPTAPVHPAVAMLPDYKPAAKAAGNGVADAAAAIAAAFSK